MLATAALAAHATQWTPALADDGQLGGRRGAARGSKNPRACPRSAARTPRGLAITGLTPTLDLTGEVAPGSMKIDLPAADADLRIANGFEQALPVDGRPRS